MVRFVRGTAPQALMYAMKAANQPGSRARVCSWSRNGQGRKLLLAALGGAEVGADRGDERGRGACGRGRSPVSRRATRRSSRRRLWIGWRSAPRRRRGASARRAAPARHRSLEKRFEPGRERGVVERSRGSEAPSPGRSGKITRRRSARSRDHGRPVDAAALDPSVKQHERRPGTAFEDRGRGAGEVEPPLLDIEALRAVAPERRVVSVRSDESSALRHGLDRTRGDATRGRGERIG